jgi:hypothetical protein
MRCCGRNADNYSLLGEFVAGIRSSAAKPAGSMNGGCLHFPCSMLRCPLYSNQNFAEVSPYSRCLGVCSENWGEERVHPAGQKLFHARVSGSGKEPETHFGGGVNLRRT